MRNGIKNTYITQCNKPTCNLIDGKVWKWIPLEEESQANSMSEGFQCTNLQPYIITNM